MWKVFFYLLKNAFYFGTNKWCHAKLIYVICLKIYYNIKLYKEILFNSKGFCLNLKTVFFKIFKLIFRK